jgi:hypothetical protein
MAADRMVVRRLLQGSFALTARWHRSYPQDDSLLSQVGSGCQMAIKAKHHRRTSGVAAQGTVYKIMNLRAVRIARWPNTMMAIKSPLAG